VIPHVARRGDGPPLLCHPGGPGFPGSELDDLGGLDGTRTLLLIDPRGSGTTPPADSYRLED
jgi:pimeloyl-ACP methyl ester carboxylesterase